MYTPNAYKLAVRTLFRQNDKNEIKGYDSTYFTRDEKGFSLWLGQAKLGGETYCKDSFVAYDDVTVRRLVECITVSNDGRIVVTLKGGFREEEII